MKIIILTQNYIPEPDLKTHTIARGLVARGNGVTVITGFPNYPQGKTYPGYRQKLFQREMIDGVRVIRLPIFPDRSRSVMKRFINHMSFALSAALMGPVLCGPADIMLVCTPPTLSIPGRLISLLRNIPYVFEIQDMWPESLSATAMILNRHILNILSLLCSFTYSGASAITVISDGFRDSLLQKNIPERKIKVIYNMAYEADFKPAAYDTFLAEEMKLRGKFNILYAGTMGPAQGLHNILNAAERLGDIKDVQFILVGSGIEKERLQRLTIQKNLANVMFFPPIPMETMPKLYASVEAVMIHLTDNPLFTITVPGKTQSCLLSGRPVIASVNGDAARIIARAGAGLTAEAMNPDALAKAVRKLYTLSVEQRSRMGEAGRNFYFTHMAPEVAISAYEKLFKEIIPV